MAISDNDLKLSLGVELNTSKASADLDNFIKKSEQTKVIKLKNGSEQFKTLSTYVNQAGQSFNTLTTAVKNSKGQLEAQSNIVTKVSNSFKVVDTYTKKYKDSSGAVVTQLKEFDKYGNSVTTTVRKYTDSLGRSVEETKKFNSAGVQIGSTTRNISENLISSEKNVRRLGQSFTDIIGKVAKFYLATLPIQMVQKAIRGAVDAVKSFDSAMTELAKVINVPNASLEETIEYTKKYTQTLADLGLEVGRTITTMTELATNFKKAGFDDEQSAKLAKLGAMYQNTADEELSASEATSVLVSQMKAFGYETAEQAEHITDAINQVSQDFAVSSGDIGKGLTQAGASLSTYGNTFEETIGLVTAGSTIFQGKSQQVARGLNTVASRIAKNEEALAKYGVSIKDSNGHLRSTYDILVDLAPKWNIMSSEQKVALGTTLAGVNQYKVFSAVMSQMDVAIEATTDALNSEGATVKQNSVYMESLEAKTNLLKASFEKFVIGDGGLQDCAKFFVSLGTGILDFINKIGGLRTVLIALISTFVTLHAQSIVNFGKGLKNLGASIKTTITAFKNARLAGLSFGQAIRQAGNGVKIFQASLGVIGIVLTAISVAMSAFASAQEKAVESMRVAKENAEKYSETSSSLKNAIKQLEDENITRTKLSAILTQNVKDYDGELDKIKDVNEARKEGIRLLEEEEQKQAQQYVFGEGNEEAYREAFARSNITSTTVRLDDDEIQGAKQIEKYFDEAFYDYNPPIDYFDDNTASLFLKSSSKEQLVESLGKALEELKQSSEAGGKYADLISDLTEKYNQFSTELANDIPVVKKYEQAMAVLGYEYDYANKTFKPISEETKKRVESYTDETDAVTTEADAIEELRKEFNITQDDIDKYKESHDEALSDEEAIQAIATERYALELEKQKVEDLGSAYDALTKNTNAVISGMKGVSSALQEQTKNGKLSIETQMSLIDAGYAMALSYDEETGACKLNEEAVVKLTKAKIQNQIADLKILQTDIQTKLKQDGLVAASSAKGFIMLANAKLQSALADNTTAMLEYQKHGIAVGEVTAEQQKLIDQNNDLQAQIEALGTTLEDLETTGIKAFGGIADASGKTADKADKLKDKYKDVINFIIKLYDKQINAIKKEKDEALKAVDAQIKALEKEKDARIKAIERQIKDLKKEKEARKKYWDEQLKSLEEENQERQRNIELREKQQALALAQQTQVKVLKDGQFQYAQDESAVASAEQGIRDTEDKNEYERQKQLIEDLRDTEMEWYEQRIEMLEEYKEQVEEYYEEQINALQEYKEQLEAEYDARIEALEEEKDKIQEILENEAETEQEYWTKMIEQLKEFVKEWNAKVGEIKFPSIAGKLSSLGFSTGVNALSTGANSINAYGSGNSSIGDSELAVVGENPKYRELVIGSKINNDQGLVMNLKRGSGVVNAGATDTLASIFNSLKGTTSNAVQNAVTNSSKGTSITIGTVNLPQVQDGLGFVKYLQNFSLDMTQRAYAR